MTALCFCRSSASLGTIQAPWFTPLLPVILPASSTASENVKFNSHQHLKAARAQAEWGKRFRQFAKNKAQGLSIGFN